ncbi:MAG TPA: AAA family ATPase [Rhodospirillaceae bacterium]|nr:AAA family ATPase [Rhodospirillaceae bacterium]
MSQSEVTALLSDPGTFGAEVRRIDTHISIVFLAGPRAYKLKREVRFPFLDFSSVEQRRQACLAELRLNRRTAPEIYLEVTAVTREADGRLAIGGQGLPVDWLVVMNRFDEDNLLDRMAAAGRLTRDQVLALADHIAAFHAQAEPSPEFGGEKGLAFTIDTNDRCFAAHALFDTAEVKQLGEASRALLSAHAPLLEQRRAAGLVRRCHGDLHLGNICLLDGRPTLFDAIEFNDDFACIDVFYDLAFLLMDMEARGLPDMASWLMNRYLERTGDTGGLTLLPLLLSLRAAIRAHVTAAMPHTAAGRALDYFRRAQTYLQPAPPRLVAVGGLSGSGKSRLARALAPFVGRPPGAVVLRSDVLRKRLMGVAPEVRLAAEAYAPEITRQTYLCLFDEAERALAGGQAVIADAVFAGPAERQAIEVRARRCGVPFAGLWLEASPEVMERRILGRRGNASDATPAVLERQLTYDLGAITWPRLDSSGARHETLADARNALRL